MPDKKITDLVDGDPLQPTDEFVVARAGDNFKIDGSAVVAAVTKHDVTLAGNTAGALALISSGTMTLAGGNNITLSQAGNGITISGGTAAAAGTSIGGISASNTLYTSGTVRFTGSNAATVKSGTGQLVVIDVPTQTTQVETQTFVGGIGNSQTTYTSGTVNLSVVAGNLTIRSTTGQAFQFSASQSVQAETQTFLGALAASNTTYTSGTVTITGVGGGVTVSSNTGQRVDISVAAQSVQTQDVLSVGASTGGNTSGNTTVNTGSRLVFAGGNNITISQGTAAGATTLTISGPNVGGAQTGISGIANSETTYTSGSVTMSALGAITIRSTTGQHLQFSVNSQTAQTGISGIANSQTTYTSGTVSLSELGAITIRSTTGNQYQLSVNAQTTQTQGILSAGVSTGGNTLGNTTVNTGSRLVFVGSGNLTASQGTAAGASTITLSVAAQTTQTQGILSAGVSTGGNTLGNTTVNTGSRLVFVGSNLITASQATAAGASTITLDATNQNLSLGVSTGGNTVGNTTVNTGSRFVIVGSGNLTASQATAAGATTVTLSVGGGAETQTAISGIANSQTTYTSGTVSLSELGAITIRSTTGNQFQLSVNAQTTQTQGILSAGVSTGGNTAGNTTVNTGSRLVFVGTNMVSLSQTTGAGATTVSINATQSVQPETQTFLGAIQNSQTTYTSGTVNLSVVAGNLTIRSTTGQALQFSMSQTVQAETQTAISGLANSQTTYTSGTVSLSELGAITIRSTTGNQFQLSVNSQTVQTQGILNVALSNIGNTSGDTGLNSGTRFVLAGGNNITLSASTAAGATTVTVSAPNLGAGAMSAGVSTGGNTAGATGITGTQMVFVGSDNITLSQTTGANGGTISIIGGGGGGFSAGASTGGNTAGATGITGTQMVFVGSSPVSLSQTTGANGGTITINAPATSSLSASGGIEISTNGSTISIGYGNNLADWQNMPVMDASLMTHVSGISKTPFYWNDHLDGDLTAKSLALRISMVTASQPLSVSAHLGVYTYANSTSANLLASHSEAWVVSSASSVSLSGVRNLIMTGIGTHATLSTISAGEYMLGLMFSATATNAMNFSLYGASGGAGQLGGLYPGTNAMSTGTSQGIQALVGRGSTTVNAMPSAVSAADLVNQGSGASAQLHPWIYIRS